MNILPAPDTDGRGDLGALYDTLGLDELSEDQRALVEDLHDERDDDTGCWRGDGDEIFFFVKDDLSDPDCESVFHPFDVDVIEEKSNCKIQQIVQYRSYRFGISYSIPTCITSSAIFCEKKKSLQHNRRE